MHVIEGCRMETAGKDNHSKCTYSERAASGAAAVDQLANRVGVVDEVRGEGRVGELVAVVVDEGLEVVGDFRCIGVGHAVGGGLLGAPGRPRCGGCMGSGCDGSKYEDGGTHVGENVLVFGENLVRKAGGLSERVGCVVLDEETIVGVVVGCERLVGRKMFPVDMSLATYSPSELAPRQGRLRYGGHEGSPPLAIGNKSPRRLRPHRCA
jgi:hypothetical protein